MKKVTEDINARGFKVAAFICEDKNGKIVIIQYNNDGLVTYISDPVESIDINERLEGNLIRHIVGFEKVK